MSSGFVHSVRVPRLYKVTAKIVQTVEEEGASLKQLIYEKKHPNLGGTYALALSTIQNGSKLDALLRKTQLLIKEPRMDPWLARVLITELLWRKKNLPTEAKPALTILSYADALKKELENLTNVDEPKILQVRKPRYIRVNTLIKSVDEFIQDFIDDGWTFLPQRRNYSEFINVLSKLDEWTFVQDFHIPELFAFPPGTQFHHHPGYKSGAIVLQDKASCFPAFLLNAPPGSNILDMCAAPGMKTTHLAAIVKNSGNIYAVEKDGRRYETLCKLVETSEAKCVTTINADAMTIDAKRCPDIEYILVDPSCSGSGMLDRVNLGKNEAKCAPHRLKSLQSFQVLLLRHALLNFPTVKRVVYSTCSKYPEENEMVVDEILDDIGDAYKLVSIKKLLGTNWKNYSSTEFKCKDNCLYSRPEDDLSNGFFVAVFERNFEVELPEYKRKFAAAKRPYEENKINEQIDEPAKKKKKNKLDKKENLEIETKSDENLEKKKKKKSKKANLENENIEEQSEIIEIPVEKKKKKKKNFDSEDFSEISTLPTEDKKKKKKSKKENIEEQSEINEISVEKKKKKKKNVDSEEFSEIPTLPTDDKKKKKKKKSESEVNEEIETQLVVEKKSKKKKNKL